MRSFSRVLAVFSMITVLPFSGLAFADTSPLEQRLDDLEQQVAILKRQIENNKEDTTAQAKTTPVVTANAKDGFSIKSPEGNFNLKIGGYTQIEGREFSSNNKEELGDASSIIPRRVRLIVQGTVAHDFDFYLQPEFGYNNTYSDSNGTISSAPGAYGVALQDAWVDWKYFPDFTIKAGKFKTPFDLENLQDTRYTDFVELGLTGNLSPQRDVGLQVGGNLYWDWIQYAAGVFDGAADKENGYGGYSSGGDTNSRNGVGRVFITPFKDTSIEPLQGLGVGYAASYGKEKGTDLPTYVSPGQAPVFAYNTGVSAAGPQLRTEPQAYYYYKSLGILGEKVDSYESLEYKSGSTIYRDKPDNKAFNVEASYVLTGEDASYNGVTPRHDFDPSSGQWGAFELVGRYGELKLDSSLFSENFSNLNTSISKENDWATGINWYLNHNVKLAFAFEQTKFRRGAPNGVSTDDRKTENLFTGLAQLSF
jgi:phosphate-selective porin OprO and OprP